MFLSFQAQATSPLCFESTLLNFNKSRNFVPRVTSKYDDLTKSVDLQIYKQHLQEQVCWWLHCCGIQSIDLLSLKPFSASYGAFHQTLSATVNAVRVFCGHISRAVDPKIAQNKQVYDVLKFLRSTQEPVALLKFHKQSIDYTSSPTISGS